MARVFVFRMATTPTAGSMIADSSRLGVTEYQFEILRPDGAAIGSLFLQGQAFGPPSPGAPAASNSGTLAIVGGTGPFLGARGQLTSAPSRTAGSDRNTSVLEDPSLRRARQTGGGKRFMIQLIPYNLPEVAMDSEGLRIFHSDFSKVSASSGPRPRNADRGGEGTRLDSAVARSGREFLERSLVDRCRSSVDPGQRERHCARYQPDRLAWDPGLVPRGFQAARRHQERSRLHSIESRLGFWA